MAQNITCAPGGGTKGPWFAGWLKCFILFDRFPLLWCFLTSLSKFILRVKFVCRQKAGGGHGWRKGGRTIASCSGSVWDGTSDQPCRLCLRSSGRWCETSVWGQIIKILKSQTVYSFEGYRNLYEILITIIICKELYFRQIDLFSWESWGFSSLEGVRC